MADDTSNRDNPDPQRISPQQLAAASRVMQHRLRTRAERAAAEGGAAPSQAAVAARNPAEAPQHAFDPSAPAAGPA